jgi:hypothetical protein
MRFINSKPFVLWGALLGLVLLVILIYMQHRHGHVQVAQWIFLGVLAAYLLQFVGCKLTGKLPVQYREH